MAVKKVIMGFLLVLCLLIMPGIMAEADGSRVFTYSGKGEAGYIDDSLKDAGFYFPYGLAFDKDGGLIIADSYNNRIRLAINGEVTTIAGSGDEKDIFGFPVGGLIDGEAAVARFNRPKDVVVNSKGDIFVSDTGNHVIRKISNGKVYTFAGNGQPGFNDGYAFEVQFNTPLGIDIDSEDNLYVADSLNNLIRKITPDGKVTTFAGKHAEDGGYNDGAAEEALFNEPSDVAVDKYGTLYVLDSGNQLVRKVEAGTVSTISGTCSEISEETGYAKGGFGNGKGEEVKYNFPKGISLTEDGTILVADTWNHRIRAVKKDGSVVTVAGTGIPGKTDGLLTDAQFNGPVDVLYNDGFLYVSDMWNNCIRAIPYEIEQVPDIIDRAELIRGIDFGEETGEMKLWFGKNKVEFPDVKPYQENKKIFVPLRFVCEAWGADVLWFNETKRVRVKKDDLYMFFEPGKDMTFFKEGRTMIDTLSLKELFGLRVEFYPEYNSVVIVEEGTVK